MTDQQIDPTQTKVMVGMSGGVDSSVSAYLLKKAGYQVEGLFMKNWDEDDGTEYCTAKEDLADAQQIATQLGIKLHTANFAAEYWDNVFEHFLKEYRAGRTPNPDILCNREIKFKAFIDYAEMLGANYIATGHYARLEPALATSPNEEGSNLETAQPSTRLLKGLDQNKDQSYFLHMVPASQLAKSIFPLGHLDKPEVRRVAAEQGFINSSKKDSTGICFIGERKFKDFLQQYIPAQPGDIITTDGTKIGEHQGLMYYTLGQRQGIGIGGLKSASDDPWYVLEKRLAENHLVIGQGQNHPLLYSVILTTRDIHWINKPKDFPVKLTAKTRYRQADQSCRVEKCDKGYKVVFDTPQRSVTPGQSVVFYLNDECLGGGIIEQTFQELRDWEAYEAK